MRFIKNTTYSFNVKRFTTVINLILSNDFAPGTCKTRVFTARMMSSDETPKYNDYFHQAGYYGNPNSPIVSLIMGAPGKKRLASCASMFQKATQHRLDKEKENGHLFQYGPTRGDWGFIKNLSIFLSEKYKRDVSMKNLMVTAGASHGLYYTASLFFKKGATVFVEDPTYFIAFKALRNDLQLNVISVPLDSQGIDLNKLEENIKLHVKEYDEHGLFKGMIYVIPAHQNPTGLCYSEERCIDLVKLAKQYNLLLFCDDVYNLLSYSGDAVPPLFYYDQLSEADSLGNVISNGTFSKLLGPGLRLGWIQASDGILNVFHKSGVMESGGCPNHYTSGILASVIELGDLNETLCDLINDYGYRKTTVCRLLKENLPKSCTFEEPKGGFFVWISLPTDVVAENIAQYVLNIYNVQILPGSRCSAKNNFKNCIRIAFTFHDEQTTFNSVLSVCNGIKEYLTKGIK